MFKTIAEDLWVIDAEWIPDPASGRRLLGLSNEVPDADVIQRLFEQAGATDQDPRPFVKTALCRLVSISAVKRKATGHHPVRLELKSLPAAGEAPIDEAEIVGPFLEAVGMVQPQIVGFYIHGADLPILVQRALATGITAPAFFKRPEKPWQGVDYFSPHSEATIDLMDVFGVRGRGSPSLNELAAVAGVPGKFDTSGEQVVDLWLEGKYAEIVHYNEYDALTTYLIWLKAARLAGFVEPAQYEAEERQLEALLRDRISSGDTHLQRWIDRWLELRGTRAATVKSG